MDLNMPDWVVDVQRQTHDMTFGRIPIEIVVANGQVTKAIGSKTTSTKFKSNDEALIYAVDHIRTILNKEATLSPDDTKNGGTISLSITHKNGKISLVNTFDTIEFNYPIY